MEGFELEKRILEEKEAKLHDRSFSEDWAVPLVHQSSIRESHNELDVWYCPNCKLENPNSAHHCKNCFRTQPLTIEQQDLRCDECHRQLKRGSYFRCTVRSHYILCPSCESAKPQPFPTIKIYDQNQLGFSVTLKYEDGTTFTQKIPAMQSKYEPTAHHSSLRGSFSNLLHLNDHSGDKKEAGKQTTHDRVRSTPASEHVAEAKPAVVHRHLPRKPFREFHPLHESKSEESQQLAKKVHVHQLDKSLGYWIGFYDIGHEIFTVFRGAHLHTVKELGRIWHENPERLTGLLTNVMTDEEERANLLRGLNDAEALYVGHKH